MRQGLQIYWLLSRVVPVSKENDGYKFVFDFRDDAGYEITGEWKGTVNVVDYSNP